MGIGGLVEGHEGFYLERVRECVGELGGLEENYVPLLHPPTERIGQTYYLVVGR